MRLISDLIDPGRFIKPGPSKLEEPKRRPMTMGESLMHKAYDVARPILGPIQHWWNDPNTQIGLETMDMVNPLATVYHGSPHLFKKFDMSKIGTGEGAQAYGHGLYFADNPQVAKSYQAETAFKHGKRDIAEMLYSQKMGDVDKAIKSLKGEMKTMKWESLPDGYIDQYNEAIKKLEGFKANPPNKGALYKVDLPDEAIGRMLDWDKPIKDQAPGIREVLKRNVGNEDLTVGQAMGRLEEALGGREQAMQFLKQHNIPGIKYFDQGSRAAGQGTRNYVVFDDQIPKILEVNDKPVSKLRKLME